MTKTWKDDPSIRGMSKSLSVPPTDMAHRPTRQLDAEVALPRVQGMIDEVDEAAHLVVFSLPPRTASGGRVDYCSSMGSFRSMDLLWDVGAVVGRISSVAMDGDYLVCTADLNNTQVVADLASGQFNGVEVLFETLSRRSDGSAVGGAVRPRSIRLVATTSSVNSELNAMKVFHVRGADGRLTKRKFMPRPHMGTGAGSGQTDHVNVIKKIHEKGGRPLSGDELMKFSTPGNLRAAPNLNDGTRMVKNIHRKGPKRLYK